MTADDRLLGVALRSPPQNLEAEQALLGAVLANNAAHDRCIDAGLLAEHFADPVHGLIWTRLDAQIRAGRRADAIALKEGLAGEGLLDEVGGTRYLAQLVSSVVGIVNAGEYARVIVHCALRRGLIDACVDTVDRAFGAGDLGAPEILGHLDETLFALSRTASAERPLVPAGKAAQAAVAAARESAEARRMRGIPTGLAGLDRMTGGLRRARMTVIGGRPGMGKTGLALTVAARSAALGTRVLYASLEMDAEELGQRLVAAASGIPVIDLTRGFHLDNDPNTGRFLRREFTAAEWARVQAAEAEAEGLPIEIDDRPRLTVAQIRARARREARRPGGLGLLVVDYAQLVWPRAEDARKTLYEQATGISADLTALAREIGCAVLLLAQLSRQSEGREAHRPTMADLRNSGRFEEDAYAVGLLWREHEYLANEVIRRRPKESDEDLANRRSAHAAALLETEGKATLFLDKHRGGPKGPVELLFDGARSWFRDPTGPEGAHPWR